MYALITAVFPGENNFASILTRYLGTGTCVLAAEGRSLLTLLLLALRKRNANRSDAVLLPGYTCYSVAAAVVRAGLKCRVYDLNPLTFAPDMASVRSAATPDTLAVVAQHLFGIPTPIDGLREVASSLGAALIEDAAQGLGGRMAGSMLGALGDYGLFSFGRGKPLPLGCGGALLDNRGCMITEGIVTGRKSAGYGGLLKTAALQVLTHPRIYRIMEALPLGLGRTVFDPGFKIAPMPPVMQRLGVRALMYLEVLNAHRRMLAGVYRSILGDGRTRTVSGLDMPVYTRFPVLVNANTIPPHLWRMGVRRMYPKAIIEVPSIRPYLASGSLATPAAARLAVQLITLPTHQSITPDMARRIAREVKELFA